MASDADIEALAALINRAYRPKQGEEGWTHEALWVSGERIQVRALASMIGNSYQHLMVLENAEHIIGSALITKQEDGSAYVGMLTIDPALQTQGLG
ncbi:MAG: GNAT family N-acetyltransferase, partial [Pseudomonadota bacterium]|nr:GNAT family N-acetyltransferase [Pseudomonadota bacterium]